MILIRGAAVLSLLLLAACAAVVVPAGSGASRNEFVGTTPCDARSREFLGGLATNVPCHSVTWHLMLITNRQARLPSTYKLVATYGLPGRNDPNQIEDGPTVKLEGKWEILSGSAATAERPVYRIHGKDGRVLHLLRLAEHLLHFSDSNHRLVVGNAGWSYTLNRKGIGHEN